MPLHEIDILYSHAKINSAKNFMAWLIKNRSESILVRKRLGPWYDEKFSITSELDCKAILQLGERIITYVSQKPTTLTVGNIDSLYGIVRRLRYEVAQFRKNYLTYELIGIEAEFLRLTDEEAAAKFTLAILEELNVPFNVNTENLYELLISLDGYYTGSDRLKQRKIIALAFRKRDIPPFYAEDNISLLSENTKVPFSSTTPGMIDALLSGVPRLNELSEQMDLTWNYVILLNSLKVFSSDGLFLGTLPSGEAEKVFLYLLKDQVLQYGATAKEIFRDSRSEQVKTFVSRLKKVIPNLIICTDKTYKINPTIKILLVNPRR